MEVKLLGFSYPIQQVCMCVFTFSILKSSYYKGFLNVQKTATRIVP